MALPKKATPTASASFPISLVIPCYNESHRVQALLVGLEQFSKQWRGDYEIILVDDGSKDDTVNLIRESALYKDLTAQNKFQVVQLSQNQGKGHALKAGVAAASKDY